MRFEWPRDIVWWHMALRFTFGGSVAVAAALITLWLGPRVGGIFLAFPTIIPAALSFIERQETRDASVRDLQGAVFGAFGLIGFALVLVATARAVPGAVALALATGAWFAVAGLSWVALHGVGPWKRAEAREGATVRSRRGHRATA